MSDKVIMLCVVLAAVAVIAIVFIRRAMRYGKATGAGVPENETMPDAEIQQEPPPAEPSVRETYLSRFISRKRHKFSKGGTVLISEGNYHLIRAVKHTIGRDKVSIVGYLDNVLNAHFENNREAINLLFDDRTDEILNGNG